MPMATQTGRLNDRPVLDLDDDRADHDDGVGAVQQPVPPDVQLIRDLVGGP
jgi:hypothetical protein